MWIDAGHLKVVAVWRNKYPAGDSVITCIDDCGSMILDSNKPIPDECNSVSSLIKLFALFSIF